MNTQVITPMHNYQDLLSNCFCYVEMSHVALNAAIDQAILQKCIH